MPGGFHSIKWLILNKLETAKSVLNLELSCASIRQDILILFLASTAKNYIRKKNLMMVQSWTSES